MNEALKSLYLLTKKKYKICPEAYYSYRSAAFTAFFTYLISRGSSLADSWLIILGFLLMMIFIKTGFDSQKKYDSKLARKASKKAQLILESVSCGEYPGPFFLYLRPFCFDNQLMVKNPHKSRPFFFPKFLFPTSFLPEEIDWENLFAESVEEFAPFIGLGVPGENIGANLIKVKKWEKIILALIEQALLIFIVPSSNMGTKWEIEMIKRGNHLSKCLFILPEGLDPFKFTISSSWITLKNEMEQIKIKIPQYDKEGIAFILDKEGNLKEVISPFSVSYHSPFPWFKEYLQPRTILENYFSISNKLNKIEYSKDNNELNEIKNRIHNGDEECKDYTIKQIDEILVKRNEKKARCLQAFEIYRYPNRFEAEKIREECLEEQVVAKFIEAIYIDNTIIKFCDKNLNLKIFDDSIKYYALVKTIGNEVYVEIHQTTFSELNIVRHVKFTISGISILNIELLEENIDKN